MKDADCVGGRSRGGGDFARTEVLMLRHGSENGIKSAIKSIKHGLTLENAFT